MNDFRRRVGAVVALAMLGACASRPIHFYSLLGTAPATPAARPAAFAIALEPVSVPRQADIPQLVVGTRSGALKLAEDHRWIAPLGEEIRAALSQQLQERLGAADVSRVAAPAAVKVYRVHVDVQRFEYAAGREVLVAALWSVRESESKAVTASCATRVNESADADYEDYEALVDAYRRALAAVAAQIADGIGALLRDPSGFSCRGA